MGNPYLGNSNIATSMAENGAHRAIESECSPRDGVVRVSLAVS